MRWWFNNDANDLQKANDGLIAVLKDQVMTLRLQHDKDLERMDRLMEALARRGGVDLVMPMPPVIPTERVSLPNPWKDPNLVTGKFQKENTQ